MAEEPSLTVVVSDLAVEPNAAAASGLVRATLAGAFRAEPIGLNRRATSAQALAVIAASCLRQIAHNEGGVRKGSGEALHQMRIGLRRLRAAVSIFKQVLRQGEFDGLKGELVWLTEQLARAREYDVLSASISKLEHSAPAGFGEGTDLRDALARRRQEAFAAASRAVAGARFERLLGSSAFCLILRADGEAAGDRAARDLARASLQRLTRRVLRRLSRFDQLDARERHRVRIQVKKLRYGTEFFASLFPRSGRSRKRFSRVLEALQDTLGRLNDAAVHRRIATDMVHDGAEEDRASRRIAFAIGTLTGNEQAELSSLVAHVPKLRARLAKAPRFFRAARRQR
jgi:triphosphatase